MQDSCTDNTEGDLNFRDDMDFRRELLIGEAVNILFAFKSAADPAGHFPFSQDRFFEAFRHEVRFSGGVGIMNFHLSVVGNNFILFEWMVCVDRISKLVETREFHRLVRLDLHMHVLLF